MHRIQWTAHYDGHKLRGEGFCQILFMRSLPNGYGGEIPLLIFYYCNPPHLPLLAVQSPWLLFARVPYCHPKAEITCLDMGQGWS